MNAWHLFAEGRKWFLAQIALVSIERFVEPEVFCLCALYVLGANTISLLWGHLLKELREIGSLGANFSAHTDLPLEMHNVQAQRLAACGAIPGAEG